ncbi:MAG: alpha/beta hydrolase [Nitrospiraceae bacterium]|nr:alpha/beta hydrolase [Nitrospiraceae bacterium]
MNNKVKRVFIASVIGIASGYLLLILFVYAFQDNMVYFPTKDIAKNPKNIGLKFENLTIETSDKVNISAWYIPAKNERGVVLFCHGNAGNISHRTDSILIFHDLRMSVLIFDYRGYGKSGGRPTEKGTYLDAEAAWDYLVKTKRISPKKILIFGRSLGSAVAAELASKHKAGALIIESGFKSIPELGQRLYPYLPVKLISRFQYSTIDKVKNINTPKLFIHSPQDEMIPFEHGLEIFYAAKGPKEFLEISGTHNEGFVISGKTYIDGLNKFISKHF